MLLEEILIIVLLGFICELIGSSLGMLYGTILSPTLIIMGYDPLIVVPSILLSQAFACLLASVQHHRLHNADFSLNNSKASSKKKKSLISILKNDISQDLKVAIFVTITGIFATIIAAITAVNLPQEILKTYIGVLVLFMGIILLIRNRYSFSWKKIFFVGLVSAFNKGISGGGFGPVLTSGQIISGRSAKKSIGTTGLTQAPICIIGFLSYWILNGISNWALVCYLTLGALLGALIGPYITAKISSEKILTLVLGVIVTLLGIWTLLQTWVF
ncbi:MAG: sulfite exporter TauE/SafE family protein [Candidatus Neomarinimicrobiota bacterium]